MARRTALDPILTPNTAVATAVAVDDAPSVTISAAASDSLGRIIYNGVDGDLYVRLGSAAASTAAYTVKMATGSYYEVPFGYTGPIQAIAAAGKTGDVLVTLLTAA